jgi:competence protein ComEC
LACSVWLRHHSGCCGISVTGSFPDPPPLAGKLLHVHAIDVGQGDSYLIVTPEKKTILIDAGPAEAGSKVVAFLRQQGIAELDLVIATHPHADHIGGMGYVLESFKVKNFLDSGQEHTTLTYRRMLEAVKKHVGRLTLAQAGQKFNLDNGITLSILAPRQPWLQNVSGSDLNANSVVVRLDYGQFSMLLTGDAEDETEDRLIDRWCAAPGHGAQGSPPWLPAFHQGALPARCHTLRSHHFLWRDEPLRPPHAGDA